MCLKSSGHIINGYHIRSRSKLIIRAIGGESREFVNVSETLGVSSEASSEPEHYRRGFCHAASWGKLVDSFTCLIETAD